MSNPVEVTPEYIAAVVEHRRGVWGEKWFADVHEHSLITGDIAALLTHLQANPRVPSDEELMEIKKAVQSNPSSGATWSFNFGRNWTLESRRRQFAPETPDVPDAVKSLLFGGSYGDAVSMAKADERILAGIELGIQMGKAK